MIESYFLEVETVLQAFSNIRTYVLKKKVYNSSQGYIGGSIFFEGGRQLDFVEVKHVDFADKIKYRYQYMDEEQSLIFRYDNAPHHKHIATFRYYRLCRTYAPRCVI
ncbi:MAG TPA: hypothetical protein EYP41_04030 [Anaerolineae bacterium]|nr:hypothetical protein [Anaerolineae bacterium]